MPPWQGAVARLSGKALAIPDSDRSAVTDNQNALAELYLLAEYAMHPTMVEESRQCLQLDSVLYNDITWEAVASGSA
jgi:hypothetical protein